MHARSAHLGTTTTVRAVGPVDGRGTSSSRAPQCRAAPHWIDRRPCCTHLRPHATEAPTSAARPSGAAAQPSAHPVVRMTDRAPVEAPAVKVTAEHPCQATHECTSSPATAPPLAGPLLNCQPWYVPHRQRGHVPLVHETCARSSVAHRVRAPPIQLAEEPRRLRSTWNTKGRPTPVLKSRREEAQASQPSVGTDRRRTPRTGLCVSLAAPVPRETSG